MCSKLCTKHRAHITDCVSSKKLLQKGKSLIVSGVPLAATKTAVQSYISNLLLAPSIPTLPPIFRSPLQWNSVCFLLLPVNTFACSLRGSMHQQYSCHPVHHTSIHAARPQPMQAPPLKNMQSYFILCCFATDSIFTVRLDFHFKWKTKVECMS